MEAKPAFELKLPATQQYPEGSNTIASQGVVVIVGANGSGKTRMGVWLEDQNPNSHRVSAQKSLTFEELIHPMDLDHAQKQLLHGHATDPNNRKAYRWGQHPETGLLTDYPRLLQFLFSDEHDKSVKYRQAMSKESVYTPPPETRLDIAKRIWESVLCNRELAISGARLDARKRGSAKDYPANQMSDGERVIFYLIGSALSVPKAGIFIVDEPELHLHRAVQSRLWDAIEAERPDCLFIYLTHDLDFAASRKGARHIWLREYSPGVWDWDTVPKTDAFPESMLLELLGSRNPILFVEGDKGGLDYFLYGKLYPGWTIIPCGSCDIVIHSTATFEQLKTLHSNRCNGIVDADARSLDAAIKLKKSSVEVLAFAEVENLFLIEPVIRYAAKLLSLDETKTICDVQDCVLGHLARNREAVVSALAANELEAAFRGFNAKAQGKPALVEAFAAVVQKVGASKVYDRWEAEIERVITTKDYTGALKYYSNKGLASAVGHILNTNLRDLILRKLRSQESAQVLSLMQAAVPQLA